MLNYAATLVALSSIAQALNPGEAGFIDGCTDTTSSSLLLEETYDQCQTRLAGLKSQVDSLVTTNETAYACEATKITEFLALPNTFQWRYNVEAIQSDSDRTLASRTSVALQEQNSAQSAY